MAEEWDGWEEWNGTDPFWVHAAAGSAAGVAEHTVMYPLDTIKTFVQAEGVGGRAQLQRLIRQHGRLRLWRGASTMLWGCAPAHAFYFSIYEWGKVALGANDNSVHTPIQSAMVGALAVVAHDAIMTPLDVIKQRMQLGFHKNMSQAFFSAIRTHGVISLYRSYPTTLIMNMPFAASSVGMNETLKRILNPSGEYNAGFSLLSGFIAGGFSGAITTPFDVIRTRLQTQHLHPVDFVSPATTTTATTQKSSKSALRIPSVLGRKLTGKMSLTAATVANSLVPARLHGGSATAFLAMGGQGARPKYTRPQRCPLPISLWASPGTSTLAAGGIPPTMAASTNCKPTTSSLVEPFHIAKRLWLAEGYRGFFRGMTQRVATQAPAVAISWTAYETGKEALLRLFVHN